MIAALEKGAAGEAVKNLTVTLKDTTSLYVKRDDGEPAVGDEVFTDEAMTTAAADGTYELTDGSSITVASGKISEMLPAEASTDVDALNAEVARLTAENATLTSRVNNATNALTTMTQNRDKSAADAKAIAKNLSELQALVLDAKIDEQEPGELSPAQKARKERRGGK